MDQNRNSPIRTGKQRRSRAAKPLSFTPTQRIRERHDGWTYERQIAFIEALAECACVDEACAKVGVSRSSAYAFRARADARSFRLAWEAALDAGVRRLAEATFSRALHGVVRPVFYKGEQIGERRYYDERLAMFLLRYRDPYRYGAWNDRERFQESTSDEPFARLTLAMNDLAEDAANAELGVSPVLRRSRPRGPRRVDGSSVLRAAEAVEAWVADTSNRRDRQRQAAIQAEHAAFERRLRETRESHVAEANKTGT